MPNTIEVPISLIQDGDLDAIRELLPKPYLFGRWATHESLGRGIICSSHTAENERVAFAYPYKLCKDGSLWSWVAFDDLTLDPVELTTLEDFKNAPIGTIVEAAQGNAFQKVFDSHWESRNDVLTDKNMAASGPWKILRLGWGK